jgi:aliphatic nitrilase
MGDSYPRIKVAAVQAASVFLDREGSTEKACRLIREAGRNGAQLIGLPEGFIPAHPVWYHNHSATGALSNRLATELFKNAVTIPGPEIVALSAAARDAHAYVVVGVCEKAPGTMGTMFNTQVYLAPDGSLIGKHQKIMPTVGERLVHTGGFGDTFGAFQTGFGPMSGLICGENSNPLAVFALTAEGTRVHVMSWPSYFPTSGDPMRIRVAVDSQAFAQVQQGIRGLGVRRRRRRHDPQASALRGRGEDRSRSEILRRQRYRCTGPPGHRRPDGCRGRHPLCRLRPRDLRCDEAAA